jgi:hypothetical protein
MKKLLFSLSIMILQVAYLAGCKQDPNITNSPMPTSANSVTWNAHPAICYVADTNIGTSSSPKHRFGIWVMDSTGSSWRCIYYNSSSSSQAGPGRAVYFPCWNPGGTSILWIDGDGTNTYLKKIDVSVVNGIPVGSNVTTVYTLTPSDSMGIIGCSWCPNSANNVGVMRATDNHNPVSSRRHRIRLVSMTSGTASDIYFTDTSTCYPNSPHFSPDGSKIAFFNARGTAATDSIRIIDLSGNVLNTFTPGSFYSTLSALDWSRTSGKLAFPAKQTSTSTNDLFTIDTAYGSSAVRICTNVTGASWSPTDWKNVVERGPGQTSPLETVKVATGDTVKFHTVGFYPNWKR